MKTLGQIFWIIVQIIAQLMWISALVGHWFVNDKIDTIYALCLAIGLMLISNRMIDDAKTPRRRAEKLQRQ